MNRSGKKCVLYPRVSTEMQVDGFSLDGQKNSLKRFADREEMEIVNIYEDAGKSGKWGTWNIETKMHGRKANNCR
ncbi:recombinase family protein [Enterococcus faecalis]